MPERKRYNVGQIVFLKEDHEMNAYKIILHFEDSQTYLLRSCDDCGKIVEAHASQIRRVEEYDATLVDGISIADIVQNADSAIHDLLSELSDEELDNLAPPDPNPATFYDQESYSLMYNAISSPENIMSAILRCATSENKLSDAELLAMRDRAEEFGCAEIMHIIDDYFEEGEDDE